MCWTKILILIAVKQSKFLSQNRSKTVTANELNCTSIFFYSTHTPYKIILPTTPFPFWNSLLIDQCNTSNRLEPYHRHFEHHYKHFLCVSNPFIYKIHASHYTQLHRPAIIFQEQILLFSKSSIIGRHYGERQGCLERDLLFKG